MNIDTFMEAFTRHLNYSVVAYPTEYGMRAPTPTVEESEKFVSKCSSRMRVALIEGTYSKDGRAMKATCKELGIKYTYKAIDAYIRDVSLEGRAGG